MIIKGLCPKCKKNQRVFTYCRECGNEYTKTRQKIARQINGEKVRAAERARRARNLERRKEIERRAGAKRASPEYLEKCRIAATELLRQRHKKRAAITVCVVCERSFCFLFGRRRGKTCSPECSEILSARLKRQKTKTRRLRKKNVFTEAVDPFKVFKRDGWSCQLCGTETPEALRGKNQPTSPELDHIIPLLHGGPHTYENTQCACRSCNRKKGPEWVSRLGKPRSGSSKTDASDPAENRPLQYLT